MKKQFSKHSKVLIKYFICVDARSYVECGAILDVYVEMLFMAVI